ncbi:MAG: translation initiation factor IF-3, partial [Solirubrobacteraceae bacterium]
MPVPRRFDRRLPERDQTRINDRIRVPEVRLIGEDGNQIGVLTTPDALKYAEERDLDLV